jgi:hypothetical protein
MKPEKNDCKWHNTYLYQSKVDRTAEYNTASGTTPTVPVHGRPDCTVQYYIPENKKNYHAVGYN